MDSHYCSAWLFGCNVVIEPMRTSYTGLLLVAWISKRIFVRLIYIQRRKLEVKTQQTFTKRRAATDFCGFFRFFCTIHILVLITGMCLRQILGLFLLSMITSIISGDINPGNPLAGQHLRVVAVDVRIKNLFIAKLNFIMKL